MENCTWASVALQSEVSGWPYAAHIPQYGEGLRQAGFTRDLIRRSVWTIGHFWAWARERDDTSGSIDEAKITAFLTWRRENGSYRHGPRRALERFLALLRDFGVVPLAPARDEQPRDALLKHYRSYLEELGYSKETVRHRSWFAAEAVDHLLFERSLAPGDLTPADIVHYVERQAPRRSAGTAQTMCSSLRSLLGFFRYSGAIATDLAASVPSVRSWKRTALPTFMSGDQLARVLAHCDRGTSAGRRDHTILLLMARLGMRANEVATLALTDIDWAEGTFQITGKGGRRTTLPLTAEVGAALADYLEHGRPQCIHREVFLRDGAPRDPFASHQTVSVIARRALARAGITGLAHCHANVFRHTTATALLNAGATLDEIGQLLRHQDHDTTRIYAKVDLGSLRRIARPWPGAVQ